LVSPNVLELITNHGEEFGGTQCPDLLVYSPDYSDWFFCEVKGPKDRIREPQRLFFEELFKVSGKEISIVKFKKNVGS